MAINPKQLMSSSVPLKSPVTRINNALKAAGREERLVRGRGYYYLHLGEASCFYSCSIPCMWLEKTQADFEFAISYVNDMFKDAHINFTIDKEQS